MPELRCIPLGALVDPPLFGRAVGALSALQNMRIRPGGYAEARGGMERLKPSGGTPVAPIGAGGITAGIEVSTSYGWIRGYSSALAANTQYSDNRQLWITPTLFGTGVVSDAEYFGADQPFNRIGILLSVAANWNVTIAYEYWNGSIYTALTTSETINWASTAQQFASWIVPTDWVPCAVGDAGTGFVWRYWIRIRMSAKVAVTTQPSAYQMFGFWPGVRDFYVASTDPRTSVSAGKLMRWGQTDATNSWWQTVTNASALYSNASAPHRMAAYRGRLFLVNGRDQLRWDGTYFTGIGLNSTAGTFTMIQSVGVGLPAGIWRYYAAWGYGPCSVFTAQPVDPISGFGVSQAKLITPTANADPLDASSIVTTAPNGWVTVTLTSPPPSGASALYIYRTPDLTSIPVASRGTIPAFLDSTLRSVSSGTLEAGAIYIDKGAGTLYPPVEAILFDNTPPSYSKYILVYQNRLFLGTDEAWYWSDPFLPDVFNRTFNYIILARALGGRNMGGAEFADQVVLYTEDQTWGLRSVELDVPQLYPIHPSIGCVAPDSVATGDGLIIWLARDGFYAWDGGRKAPTKISETLQTTFSKMNFEAHGGTRGIIHNRRYDVRLMSPGGVSLGLMYSYDLESGTWSTYIPGDTISTWAPLCNIHAPLGHADAGVPHPIFCKVDPQIGGGFDYHIYLGEYTTQDNASNYVCAGTMHFPQAPGQVFSPSRTLAYYQTDSGWSTVTLQTGTNDLIGSNLGTIVTGSPDTGDDYSVLGGTFSAASRGASDVKVTFYATTAAGGGVGKQRLFGAIVEGQPSKIRRGSV